MPERQSPALTPVARFRRRFYVMTAAWVILTFVVVLLVSGGSVFAAYFAACAVITGTGMGMAKRSAEVEWLTEPEPLPVDDPAHSDGWQRPPHNGSSDSDGAAQS